MVQLNSILKVMDEYIDKCTDYPKYQALKYFKEHKEEFQDETWDNGDGSLDDGDAPVGNLQQLQEDLQDEVDYDGEEMGATYQYSRSDFCELQKYNNGIYDKDYTEVDVYDIDDFSFDDHEDYIGDYDYEWYDLEKTSQLIDSAIDKSPRLAQDTVFHRLGRIDNDGEYNEEGDHNVFRGFTGLSYNPNVPTRGLDFAGWMHRNNRYNLKIYAMKGTKGMALYPHNGCHDWQAEFLLGRGQKFIVVSRNDNTMEAEILLY